MMGQYGEASSTITKSKAQKQVKTKSVPTKLLQSTNITFESQPTDALHIIEGEFNQMNKYCCELIKEIGLDRHTNNICE